MATALPMPLPQTLCVNASGAYDKCRLQVTRDNKEGKMSDQTTTSYTPAQKTMLET